MSCYLSCAFSYHSIYFLLPTPLINKLNIFDLFSFHQGDGSAVDAVPTKSVEEVKSVTQELEETKERK